MAKENAMLTIEVIYALPHEQRLLSTQVAEGATVEDGIKQSGILERYPELDLAQVKLGIFSKGTTLKAKLRDRDRVEIYRPLIADPKEVRKRRAAEGKAKKKGGT